MTTQNVLSRTADPQRVAVRQLAWVEGRRMLRHPAPWIGLVLTVLWTWDLDDNWSTERYEGLAVAPTPLLLGISLASLSAFAKERVPVADAAPLGPSRRAAARLLGGLPLIGLMLLVVVAGEVWLRFGSGVGLGDEPGHTDNAHFTLPELLQPVLLAALAVAIGAVAVRTIRHRLAAAIALFLGWFLVGSAYWMFNGSVLRWLTPIQVQPLYVDAGPASTDPTTFPGDWLLAAPSDWQDDWARLVVSPSLAAWHDVYLVALTVVAVGAVIPGRSRRPLLLAGAVLGVAAVLLQRMVTP
jgi:hypothetical protein